jgi:hypothetical protein
MLHFLISYYFTSEMVIPAEMAVGELPKGLLDGSSLCSG